MLTKKKRMNRLAITCCRLSSALGPDLSGTQLARLVIKKKKKKKSFSVSSHTSHALVFACIGVFFAARLGFLRASAPGETRLWELLCYLVRRCRRSCFPSVQPCALVQPPSHTGLQGWSLSGRQAHSPDIRGNYACIYYPLLPCM